MLARSVQLAGVPAEMAGEVRGLPETAVQSLERRPPDFVLPPRPQGGGEVAVEVVARLAHQVHEAIGFTQAHRLHHLTRRLWW